VKKNRLIILTLGLMFSLVFLVIQVSAQPKSVKIGWTGPLSGPAAESGIAMKQAGTLVMEEWNAKGGIYIEESKKKLPVEILFEDCQSKPEIGVNLGEKFITRDKVCMLLSDALHSSVTLAVMELAPKYGVPIMSLAPVSDQITNKITKDPARYWSFWKGDISTLAFSEMMFDTYDYLIREKAFVPKNKTVSFFVEDTDYGRSYAAQIGKLFEKLGWKTAAIETVPLGHTDCYPQLTKLKGLNPDVLFTCFTSISSGVAAVKQFHELGLKCSHYGIYYTLKPEFMPQAGKSAECLLWGPMNLDPEHVPMHKEFADKIRKRWNVTINWDIAMGYDSVNNALDAVERAGTLDSKKIVEALSKLDRKGVMGRYVFNPSNHEIKAGADFFSNPTGQVVGGKSAIIWPPNIAGKKYVTPPWIQ
jgi:branched-chain amino acid transport system substrate-binding protein